MHKHVLCGFVGALLLTACAPSYPTGTPPNSVSALRAFYSDIEVAEAHRKVEPELVLANTAFAFKLFSRVVETDRLRNILLSPSSMAMLLAMLHNGADGETRQEIARVLELPNIESADLNHAYQILANTLAHPHPETEAVIANSLWVRPEVILKPEFVQDSQTYYHTDIRTIDLSNPQTVQEIDSWAKEKTSGLISKVTPDLSPNAVSVLINALYFKGRWLNPFSPEQTKDHAFTLPDGTTKLVPMMFKKTANSAFGYQQGDHFQAIRMEYGSVGVPLGGTPDSANKRSDYYSVSMYIFLPDKDSSLHELLKSLTSERWALWMSGFAKEPGTVIIPRFKFDYDVEVNDVLRAMGMASAFDTARANFSKMTSSPMSIGKTWQKTAIDVNEEGTTAAALSGAEQWRTARIGGAPFEFIADHPFFFVIRDDITGSILFLGTVVDPQP